ncbi:MAG: HAMP domain-containing histidine kinase, partial [Oscillospiraceae bacterium]|nr:HAMP domain-containing histidine kinase [Oscillospiraceae bacterium]
MNFFRSIKVRVWALFEIVVIAMLTFTYIFLIAMFPNFYEWMKTYEISEALVLIRTNWNNDNIAEIINKQAAEKKMYIEIYFPSVDQSYYANRLGGSFSLAVLAKKNLRDEVKASEKGIVYKRFRDEAEDNSVLMMGSYIGENQYDPQAYIVICNYLQPIGTTVEIFVRQFFVVGILMIVLTVFMSVLFSNKISEPIIRMNKSAKELPQGKFSADIGKNDYAEIKQLASTLTSASKEIAKSDDLRRELMANISHDLRTPLTMIKAYAEMIRDLSGDNPEKRERHLKIIIDETDRLSSLVTDILDLSKVQAGVAEMNLETFDFSSRLSGVISRFDIMKENDGIIIDLQAEDGIMITADITKLEQVVYNLINNAVTYVGSDKTVTVRLFRKDSGLLRFEVEDHGEGISAENLPYIWDRYYKVSHGDSTHKRAKMGSGIGLSIVKGVLEQHKFAYGAQSEEGKGSTFWFEAPEYSETPPEHPKSALRRFVPETKHDGSKKGA